MVITYIPYVYHYIYTYKHTIMQKAQLTSSINIVLENVASDSLTAWLNSNFKQTVQQFIVKCFCILAMVKQLGIPIFFLTLLCADLTSIISKFNSLNISDEDICNMTYNE